MPIATILAAATFTSSPVPQTVPVLSADPIIRNEAVMVHSQNCQAVPDYTNRIVGAVVGGLIGSHIGSNDRVRNTMTVVGTVAGSQVIDTNDYKIRCSPTYSQQAIPTVVGYNVTYIVNGVKQTTRMDQNPGSHITIEPTYIIRR